MASTAALQSTGTDGRTDGVHSRARARCSIESLFRRRSRSRSLPFQSRDFPFEMARPPAPAARPAGARRPPAPRSHPQSATSQSEAYDDVRVFLPSIFHDSMCAKPRERERERERDRLGTAQHSRNAILPRHSATPHAVIARLLSQSPKFTAIHSHDTKRAIKLNYVRPLRPVKT